MSLRDILERTPEDADAAHEAWARASVKERRAQKGMIMALEGLLDDGGVPTLMEKLFVRGLCRQFHEQHGFMTWKQYAIARRILLGGEVWF